MKQNQIRLKKIKNIQIYVVQSYARPISINETTNDSFLDDSRILLEEYEIEITENKAMLSLTGISLYNSLESFLNQAGNSAYKLINLYYTNKRHVS